MAEAIRKENIVEMPDGSDMIAEAMREVLIILGRLSTQSTTSRQSISCPSTSSKNLMKSMGPTGTALLAKTSIPTSATKPKIISSSTKVN